MALDLGTAYLQLEADTKGLAKSPKRCKEI